MPRRALRGLDAFDTATDEQSSAAIGTSPSAVGVARTLDTALEGALPRLTVGRRRAVVVRPALDAEIALRVAELTDERAATIRVLGARSARVEELLALDSGRTVCGAQAFDARVRADVAARRDVGEAQLSVTMNVARALDAVPRGAHFTLRGAAAVDVARGGGGPHPRVAAHVRPLAPEVDRLATATGREHHHDAKEGKEPPHRSGHATGSPRGQGPEGS
jgi:hypothetical protein